MNKFTRGASHAFLLVSVLLVGACTTWKPGDGQEYIDKRGGFSLNQSETWYRSPFKARGFLTYTKDGPDLQYMIVGRKTHEKAFKQIELESSASDLPQNLAENFVADIKASLGLDVIEVLENSPAEVGGFPGFKLEIEYKTESGLRYRERIYGAATEHGLYSIEFRAPVLHYFDRDIEEFEEIRRSFKIIDTPEVGEKKRHFISMTFPVVAIERAG